jgi:hypothetical protein
MVARSFWILGGCISAVASPAFATSIVNLHFSGTFLPAIYGSAPALAGQTFSGDAVYDLDGIRLPIPSGNSHRQFTNPISFTFVIGNQSYIPDAISADAFEFTKNINGYGEHQYRASLNVDSYLPTKQDRPIQPEDLTYTPDPSSPPYLFFTFLEEDGDRAEGLAAYSFTPVSSSVPAPAIWQMLIGGFGFVGVMMRHRQRANVRFAQQPGPY